MQKLLAALPNSKFVTLNFSEILLIIDNVHTAVSPKISPYTYIIAVHW
jgi:hypothetical protein